MSEACFLPCELGEAFLSCSALRRFSSMRALCSGVSCEGCEGCEELMRILAGS